MKILFRIDALCLNSSLNSLFQVATYDSSDDVFRNDVYRQASLEKGVYVRVLTWSHIVSSKSSVLMKRVLVERVRGPLPPTD